ncbi:unnamed protein product [Lepidochelys kempii]
MEAAPLCPRGSAAGPAEWGPGLRACGSFPAVPHLAGLSPCTQGGRQIRSRPEAPWRISSPAFASAPYAPGSPTKRGGVSPPPLRREPPTAAAHRASCPRDARLGSPRTAGPCALNAWGSPGLGGQSPGAPAARGSPPPPPVATCGRCHGGSRALPPPRAQVPGRGCRGDSDRTRFSCGRRVLQCACVPSSHSGTQESPYWIRYVVHPVQYPAEEVASTGFFRRTCKKCCSRQMRDNLLPKNSPLSP